MDGRGHAVAKTQSYMKIKEFFMSVLRVKSPNNGDTT